MTRLTVSKKVPDPAAGDTPQARRRLPWKKVALYAILACGLVPLAGLLLMAVLRVFIADSGDVLKVQALASHLHTWGLVIQCAAVAVVIARWKHLVAWAAAKGIVQPFERERALAFRGKAAAFLLAYLLLIPIGPYRLWLLFTGAAG